MGLFQSLSGRVAVRITGADIPGLLSKISRQNIPVFDLEYTDDLTVTCLIRRNDYRTLKQITQRRGDQIHLLYRQGIYWAVKSLVNRPVLLVGMILFLGIALFLPSRILFIRVEGNQSVPTQLILTQAEDCGLSFGSSRRQIRSEKVKNALVQKIPELQWVGVNTAGCVATIRVSEKTVAEKEETPSSGISSIVASRDGVITQFTATKGTVQCKVGQAVKAGQTLISGYTDCGITIKATRAEGEIYARTFRDLNVITLRNGIKRDVITRQETKYSLIIGKNLIKLYNTTGISGTDCVKMYKENYITLPGGFQLPIAIVRETWVYYECDNSQATTTESYDWLQGSADVYLKSQMVAGTVVSQKFEIFTEDGIYRLRGQYACLEMIGKVKDEEIMQK